MPSVFTLFGKLEADTQAFQNSLLSAEKRLKSTEKSITDVENKSKSLGQTSQATARNFERLNDKLDLAKQRLTQTAAAFQKGEATSKQMASALSAVERATNNVNSKLRDQSARLSDISSKTGKVESAMMSVAKSFGLAAVAASGFLAKDTLTVGIAYEKSLNTLQAVTKATGEEMKQVATIAKKLGADITLPATSAADAATAMTELAKAGLNVQQSMDAAKGVLQLAAAGQLEEARAAEIAANALNSFKLQASDTVRVADLLAAASNASSAEVSQIAESMQQASAVFAGAKIPIEDLTTAISLMANAGIKGSDAGTSLKTFISRLTAPTDGAAASMKQLGVEIFDAQGKMRDLPNIIGQFEQSLAKLTDQQKAEALYSIFGSDALRAAQILFTEGTKGFTTIKEKITAVGAATELAAAKTKGLGGAWDALKSQFETLQISLFEKIAPNATEIISNFGKELDSAVNADNATLKSVGMRIGNVIGKGIGEQLKLQIPSITNTIGEEIKNNFAGKSVPIPIAANVSIGKGILEGLSGKTINNMREAMSALKEIVTNGISDLGRAIASRSNSFVNTLHDLMSSGVRMAMFFPTKFATIGAQIVRGLINGIKSGWSWLTSTVADLANSALAAAKSALGIQSPSKEFFKIGKNVTEGFIDGINSLKASAQSAMASLLDVSGLKLGKTDSAGVELLTSLTNELAKLGIETKTAEIALELTSAKYSKLNAAVKERIQLAAAEIDRQKQLNANYDKFTSAFDSLLQALAPAQTELEKVNEMIASAGMTEAIKKRADAIGLQVEQLTSLVKLAAMLKEFDISKFTQGFVNPNSQGLEGETGIPTSGESNSPFNIPPPPIAAWESFFGNIQARLQIFKNSLPTMSRALSNNLSDALLNVSDVFANSIRNWDGTLQGFFKSVAKGFADMAAQIASELIRLMIYKSLLKLFSGLASSGVGSMGSHGGADIGGGGFGGHDMGGLGGRTSAMATQAAMSSVTNNNRSNTYNLNVSFSNGSTPQDKRSERQVTQQIMAVLQKAQMQNG